jgi:hypothetical protein
LKNTGVGMKVRKKGSAAMFQNIEGCCSAAVARRLED